MLEMTEAELKEVSRFAAWLKSAQELLKTVDKSVVNIQPEYKVQLRCVTTHVKGSVILSKLDYK